MVVEPPPDSLLKRDQQFKWTEQRAQKALINCLDIHINQAFPNVMLGGGEMDLAVLSKRRYLTEFEIKLTPVDWRRDKLKDKWLEKNAHHRQVVKYFCFAVPVELMNAMPEDLDPNAGIVALFWDYTTRGRIDQTEKRWKVWGQWVKQPTAIKHAQPVAEDIYRQLLMSVYHRYWNQIYTMSVLDPRLMPMPEPDDVDQPPSHPSKD